MVSISGPTEVTEAGQPVTFTATLSAPQTRPVEVSYFISGTATARQDYRLALGTGGLPAPSGTLIFKPGTTWLPIAFTPIGDTIREGNEDVRFSLAAVRGHTLGTKTAVCSIIDDDNYTASVTGPARVQANTTSRFTIQLSSPATRNETFYVNTEDRTASSSSDYAPLRNLPVTFSPGQQAKHFRIATRPAGSAGFDRSFVVTVSSRAKDVPAVLPVTVTIAGNGTAVPPGGPPILPATFTHDYGWGVVNAAAAVGKMLGGTTALPEVANLGGVNWGNDIVRAPEAWARGYTGNGIVVAVVDTGVDYTHPSLVNSIWVNPREIANDGIDNDNNGFIDDVRGWDFFGNDNDPMDDIGYLDGSGGHGTHVAGTISAAASTDRPRGVAFDAKVMAVRLSNQIRDDNYLASSILYAANNGAHVINLSLGVPPSLTVTDAIRFATSLGSIVVVASGNDGRPQADFPASLATVPGVIAVGAVDGTRTVAPFSNRAGTSNALRYVTAPGVQVVSTVPRNYPGASASAAGSFVALDGTSMAAPHVAGVVALALSAVPNPRTPGVRDRIVNALFSTAQQPPAITMAAMASALEAGQQPRTKTARAFAALQSA